MHELGITRTLLEMILKESIRPQKAVVELGKLSIYKKEPIEYYFEILKQEYKATSKTEIEIIEKPGTLKCEDCKMESMITSFTDMLCPQCQSFNTTILNGKEVILKEIIEGE